MANKVRYPAYANWKVTTEGDCEGRTVRDLGTHTGFIDEIAFKLGRQAYYSLSFQRISDVLEKKPDPEPVRSISINLAIDSGTWDMSSKERARYVAEILQGRPVEVKEGTYYASVILNNLEVS